MNRENPLIVFGDEWGHHPTSVQHLAKRLASLHPLLYVNTLWPRRPRLNFNDAWRVWRKARRWVSAPRSVDAPPGLNFYSPVVFPFVGVNFIRRWNKHTLVRGLRERLRLLDSEAPILMVSLPLGAEVLGTLDECLVIYYVADQYTAMPTEYAAYIKSMENRLLSEADLIFVTSTPLQREKNGKKVPAVLLPHGVDFEHFHSAADPLGSAPKELEGLPRPLLGYFGLLAPWTDADLLERLARAFPEASVVLIGPKWIDFSMPKGLSNLHWLGPCPYADLPHYAAHFDVGLIPYKHARHMPYVSSLKLLEYLALGLPVVSTPFPDLGRFASVVYQAGAPDDYVDQVRRALAEDSPERRKQRFEVAAGESWESRAKTLENHIERAMSRRRAS